MNILDVCCGGKMIIEHHKLKAENDELRAENEQLKHILKRLKRGSCWCEAGIGNPMVSGHSEACEEAQKMFSGPKWGE